MTTFLVLEKVTAVMPRDVAIALYRHARDMLCVDTDEFDYIAMPNVVLVDVPGGVSLERYARYITRELRYWWDTTRSVSAVAFSGVDARSGIIVTLAPTVGLASLVSEADL
jgi:hypothetical protein